jgi:hypothetical protein
MTQSSRRLGWFQTIFLQDGYGYRYGYGHSMGLPANTHVPNCIWVLQVDKTRQEFEDLSSFLAAFIGLIVKHPESMNLNQYFVCPHFHSEGWHCSTITALSLQNRNQDSTVSVGIACRRPYLVFVCVQPNSCRFGCFSLLHFLIAPGHRRYGSGLQLTYLWCLSEGGQPLNDVLRTKPKQPTYHPNTIQVFLK